MSISCLYWRDVLQHYAADVSMQMLQRTMLETSAVSSVLNRVSTG